MKLFLYGHGGSRNHGCEAIVRSTTAIFSDASCTLFSFRPAEDQAYGIDAMCSILDPKSVALPRMDLRFLSAYAHLKLRNDPVPMQRYHERCILRQGSKGHAVALSIGGDNYCYSRADADLFEHHRSILQENSVKTVLWGCSVDPERIDEGMARGLSRYDLIVTRESITYEALRQINTNTILTPDPAFTLPCAEGIFPAALRTKPYIGINVSPLIQGLEQHDGITMQNYRKLLAHILSTTDRNIALIPHVIWTGNDDRIPLQQLYDEFKDTGRVFLIEDQDCTRLKGVISGCEFFVGARTHATIAAYSTNVPTLVVGYSVKARGIAKDLFGTEKDYVLPVQQLEKEDELIAAFLRLYSRAEGIREHLCHIMPGYIQRVSAARNAVEALETRK